MVYADAGGFHSVPLRPQGGARPLMPPIAESPVTFWPDVGFTNDSSQVFLGVSTLTSTSLYRAPVDGAQPATLVLQLPTGSATTEPIDRFENYRCST